jgi:hypothetical protein
MIEKKTVIDQIEVTRSGHVQVRLAILVIEDGIEISSRWHRVTVDPGGDVDAAIAAVNTDITTRDTLKASPIDAGKIPLLKSICKVAHTPEVIAQHKIKEKQNATV